LNEAKSIALPRKHMTAQFSGFLQELLLLVKIRQSYKFFFHI
jgi:hypothetical protein